MEILKDLIIAYLPVGVVVENGRVSVSFFWQVEDQVWVSIWLRHCRNRRELQLLSKLPRCIRHREEDAEAILDSPLYLPPDKHVHLRVAGQGGGTPWICLSTAPGETMCGWCGRGCSPLPKTLGVPHLDT